MPKISPQNYPRIQDQKDVYYSCLDDKTLETHLKKISHEEMTSFIVEAIRNAENKSSRAIVNIPDSVSAEEVELIYTQEGKELFNILKNIAAILLLRHINYSIAIFTM